MARSGRHRDRPVCRIADGRHHEEGLPVVLAVLDVQDALAPWQYRGNQFAQLSRLGRLIDLAKRCPRRLDPLTRDPQAGELRRVDGADDSVERT